MIVTIARQLGSGGGTIGQAVAERLAMAYVDREIIQRAAEMAEVSEDVFHEVDERHPSFLERVLSLVVGYQSPVAPEYLPPDAIILPQPAHDSYHQLVEEVIKQVATRGDAVIVGRAGQAILHSWQPALHVYVYAPLQIRVQRVAEREGIDAEAATKRVHESDRNRAGYLRTYYRVAWHNPELYDLIINTGRLSFEQATGLIVAAANAQRERKQAG
ncbi:MAG: cytidylate kinase-like family protein [Chloroflexota bacterium]